MLLECSPWLTASLRFMKIENKFRNTVPPNCPYNCEDQGAHVRTHVPRLICSVLICGLSFKRGHTDVLQIRRFYIQQHRATSLNV